MEYLKDWDRETTILFLGMIVGSFVWVVSERIALGILMGFLTHLAFTAVYEACARTLGLPHLSYVKDFERNYLPRIMRMIPSLRLKRQV